MCDVLTLPQTAVRFERIFTCCRGVGCCTVPSKYPGKDLLLKLPSHMKTEWLSIIHCNKNTQQTKEKTTTEKQKHAIFNFEKELRHCLKLESFAKTKCNS